MDLMRTREGRCWLRRRLSLAALFAGLFGLAQRIVIPGKAASSCLSWRNIGMSGGFTKHERDGLGGLLIAGVLGVMLSGYSFRAFVPKDPHGPLARAGGLKPEPPIQSMRRRKL